MKRRELANRLGAAVLSAAMIFTSFPMIAQAATTDAITPEEPKLEGIELSEEQMEAKEMLCEDVIAVKDAEAGKDYVADQVIFLCDSAEEAEKTAEAYSDITGRDVTVLSYEFGVAVFNIGKEIVEESLESIEEVELSEEEAFVEEALDSMETVEAFVNIAANTAISLPAVYPNYIRELMSTTYDDNDVAFTKVGVTNTDNEDFHDPLLKTGSTYINSTGKEMGNFQWHHELVGSKFLWNAAKDDLLPASFYTELDNSIVAVIDTGYTNASPDAADLVDPYNFFYATNSESEKDSYEADGTLIKDDYFDQGGHGTNVSGIIVDKAGNDYGGRGIATVVDKDGNSHGAKLMPLRVFGNTTYIDGSDEKTYTYTNSGRDSSIVRACNYVLSKVGEGKNIRVVNMSLGGNCYSSVYEPVFSNLNKQGVSLVAAASNENYGGLVYPAANEHTLSVAALNSDYAKSAFSNFGKNVDIAAPGGEMHPAPDAGSDSFLEEFIWTSGFSTDEYIGQHGTSQATPVVSGALAILYAMYPDMNVKEAEATLTSTAKPINTGYNVGTGCLDIEAALNLGSGVNAPSLTAGSPEPGILANDAQIGLEVLSTYSTEDAPYVNKDAVIYYTTNGLNPQINNLYSVDNKKAYTYIYDPSEPINISGKRSVSVKAVAVLYGKTSSVATFDYRIDTLVSSIKIKSQNGFKLYNSSDEETGVVIKQGSVAVLTAECAPSYALNKQVTWSSSDTSVADVTYLGNVMGVAESEFDEIAGKYIPVTITAEAKDGSGVVATYDVYVYPEYSSVAIDETAASVELINGSTYNLGLRTSVNPGGHVVVKPERILNLFDDVSELIRYTVTNKKILEVSDDGMVKAVGSGKAVVTIYPKEGLNVIDTLEFNVVTPMTSLDIEDKNTNPLTKNKLAEGATLVPVVTFNGGDSVPDNKDLIWTLDNPDHKKYVSIDRKTGVVTARTGLYEKGAFASGTIDITIVAESVKAPVVGNSYTFTLYPATAEVITDASYARMPYSSSAVYSYMAEDIYGLGFLPEDATMEVYKVTSTNPSVAALDKNNVVIPKSYGKTNIIFEALDGSHKKRVVTLEVARRATENISIVDNNATRVIYPGKTLKFSATAESDYLVVDPSWSFITDGCTDLNNYLSVANGVVSTKATLKYLPNRPTDSVPENILYNGDKVSLVLNSKVGDKVATASCDIEVYNVGTSSINDVEFGVTQDDASAFSVMNGLIFPSIGGEGFLIPHSLPVDACQSHYSFKSSNPKVAEVYPGGYIKAVGNGDCVITVIAGDGSGKKTQVKVSVAQNSTGITVGTATGTTAVASQRSIQMKASFDTDAYGQEVSWQLSDDSSAITGSADIALARIDKNGKLTAKRVDTLSTVYVRAAWKNKIEGDLSYSDWVAIDIYPAAVRTVNLEESGKKIKDLILYTEGMSTVNIDITNVSAKNGVACADQYAFEVGGQKILDKNEISIATGGPNPVLVIPQSAVLGSGICNITVTALDGSNVSAKLAVKVYVPVNKIEIANVAGTTEISAKASAKFVVTSFNDNLSVPSMKTVKWAVVDENNDPLDKNIATINDAGLLKPGRNIAAETLVKVFAYSNYPGVASDYYEIMIKPQAAKKVTITEANNSKELKLCSGSSIGDFVNSGEIEVLIYGDGDYSRIVRVTSSDPSVADVAYNDVTNKYDITTNTNNKTGVAVITASALDGSGATARYTVRVVNPVREMQVRSISTLYAIGQNTKLQMKATPTSYASDRSVEWMVEGPDDKVTVSRSGLVKADKDADITSDYTVIAIAKDGSGVTAAHKITVFKETDKVVVESDNNLTSIKVGEEETFTVHTEEADALQMYKITYTTGSGKAIVLDDAGTTFKVIGIKPGAVTVTATALDGSGKKATYRLKILK